MHEELPADFGDWILAAVRVYQAQGIRYDGWLGSDADGAHWRAAADGEDLAYVADPGILGFREERDGVVDDPGERSWVCLDLALHAITLAGYPLRQAIIDDHALAPQEYAGGGIAIKRPRTVFFFRRVGNVQTFFRRSQHYAELRVSREQLADPAFRPAEPFRPGDLAFLGHYGDPAEKGGPWAAQHVAIVESVDERGLPVGLYNVRPSGDLLERFDGQIRQLRYIEGESKHFRRYLDRYSLIGLGRIARPYRSPVANAE